MRSQVVIVPVGVKKEADAAPVMEAVGRLEAAAKAAGIRVKVRVEIVTAGEGGCGGWMGGRRCAYSCTFEVCISCV
jgi:hypothetical protein